MSSNNFSETMTDYSAYYMLVPTLLCFYILGSGGVLAAEVRNHTSASWIPPAVSIINLSTIVIAQLYAAFVHLFASRNLIIRNYQLERQLYDTQQFLKTSNASVAALKTELAATKARDENQYTSLVSQIQSANETLKLRDHTIAELRREIHRYKRDLGIEMAQHGSTKEELKQSEAREATLARALEAKPPNVPDVADEAQRRQAPEPEFVSSPISDRLQGTARKVHRVQGPSRVSGTEKTNLLQRTQDLVTRLKKATEERDELEKKISAMAAHLQQTAISSSDKVDASADLEQELAESKSQCKNLQERSEQELSANKTLTAELDAVQNKLEQVKKEAESLRGSLDKCENARKTVTQEADAAQKDRDRVMQENQELHARMSVAAAGAIQRGNESVTQLQTERDELKTQINDLQQRVKGSSVDVQTKNGAVQAAQAEIKQLKQEREKALNDAWMVQHNLNESREQNKRASVENVRLTERLNQLRDLGRQVEKQLNDAITERDRLSQKLYNLRQSQQAPLDGAQERDDELNAAQAQVLRLNEQNQRLESQLLQTQKAANERIHELELQKTDSEHRYEERLEEARVKIDDLDKEANGWYNDFRHLEAELADLERGRSSTTEIETNPTHTSPPLQHEEDPQETHDVSMNDDEDTPRAQHVSDRSTQNTSPTRQSAFVNPTVISGAYTPADKYAAPGEILTGFEEEVLDAEEQTGYGSYQGEDGYRAEDFVDEELVLDGDDGENDNEDSRVNEEGDNGEGEDDEEEEEDESQEAQEKFYDNDEFELRACFIDDPADDQPDITRAQHEFDLQEERTALDQYITERKGALKQRMSVSRSRLEIVLARRRLQAIDDALESIRERQKMYGDNVSGFDIETDDIEWYGQVKMEVDKKVARLVEKKGTLDAAYCMLEEVLSTKDGRRSSELSQAQGEASRAEAEKLNKQFGLA